VDVGGRTFQKDDIHRLILKNGITDQELAGVQITTTNTNAMAGMAFRAQAGEGIIIMIDDRDIMALPDQQQADFGADASTTHDNDFHLLTS
jgi:hypothetical protein